jgi:hypothetical protein
VGTPPPPYDFAKKEADPESFHADDESMKCCDASTAFLCEIVGPKSKYALVAEGSPQAGGGGERDVASQRLEMLPLTQWLGIGGGASGREEAAGKRAPVRCSVGGAAHT